MDMVIVRLRQLPSASLLLLLVVLIALLSGPSAAAHSTVADIGSGPHIEGLSPHGDEATIRASNWPAFAADAVVSPAAVDIPSRPPPAHRLRWINAPANAYGSTWAVAASPWSGRSPPAGAYI